MERWSSAFALTADSVLISLGPALKRKEKLTGRLADVMSSLYQASAVLKKFREDGEPEADQVLLDWSMARLGHEIETALDAIIRNLPNRMIAGVLRVLVFPYGRTQAEPDDPLGSQVASIALEPSSARDRLTEGAYIALDLNDPVGRVEMALTKVIAAEPAKRKLHKAVVSGRITADLLMEQVQEALDTGLLDQMEVARIRAAETARNDVIAVDDFTPQSLKQEQSWPEPIANPSIS
jgi:acyl-CoA dehydrogenase